jgi:putative transposase
VFVLVFLHVGTRRAFVTPTTTNPTEAWVREQTREYLQHPKAEKLPFTMLFHDNDSKFSKAVDQDLKDSEITVCKTAFRAPNTNAYVERFIQSIQQECLDHFVILGQRHFDHLVAEWLEHYHTERPHQGKDNDLLSIANTRGRKSRRPKCHAALGVACRERLGGLLKSYSRRCA